MSFLEFDFPEDEQHKNLVEGKVVKALLLVMEAIDHGSSANLTAII